MENQTIPKCPVCKRFLYLAGKIKLKEGKTKIYYCKSCDYTGS